MPQAKDMIEVIAKTLCKQEGNDPHDTVWVGDESIPLWKGYISRAKQIKTVIRRNQKAIRFASMKKGA